MTCEVRTCTKCANVARWVHGFMEGWHWSCEACHHSFYNDGSPCHPPAPPGWKMPEFNKFVLPNVKAPFPKLEPDKED